MKIIIWHLFQGIVLLIISPLVHGVIKKAKARMQNRYGPPVLQPYRDIIKMMQRETVTSFTTSLITRVTPYITLSSYIAAGSMIPLFGQRGLIFSDIIVFIYLFGLARFFIALSALEPASAFGGMGSSREVMIAGFVEPVLVLGLFGIVAVTKTLDLGLLTGIGMSPEGIIAFVGLMLVTIAETGRIPVDNPDTHLELTMVHEGMLLEYSGKQLGLLHLGAWVKQTVLIVLLVHLFFPSGSCFAWLLPILLVIKVLFIGLLLALVETITAKMRLFRLPELMAGGAVLCLIAILMQNYNR